MKLPSQRSLFTSRQPLISTAAVILFGLILAGIVFLSNTTWVGGSIEPLFQATPTATRSAFSYLGEGNSFFVSGDLNSSIQAYQDALKVDPANVETLIELARLQTYSSANLTQVNTRTRLQEARESIDRAVEIDGGNSAVHAVRALVLDWQADVATTDERAALLIDAHKSAVLAVQLDSQNALAIAYRAEILTDQLEFPQARQLAEQAVELLPDSMDTHRIFAYILESTGNYSKAIEEYKLASDIMPNLTFLYIKIGQNYRQLEIYNLALEYFDRAAKINELLDIQDPLPYVAIAKTYSRKGEFFIAARNMERAIDFDTTNAELYGELGLIRFRSRNYEGSIEVLKCAVVGCQLIIDPFEGIMLLDNLDEEEQAGTAPIAVEPLSLRNTTVVFYYTYGSVLAALEHCDLALPILEEVSAQFSQDEIIMGIVEESLFICS